MRTRSRTVAFVVCVGGLLLQTAAAQSIGGGGAAGALPAKQLPSQLLSPTSSSQRLYPIELRSPEGLRLTDLVGGDLAANPLAPFMPPQFLIQRPVQNAVVPVSFGLRTQEQLRMAGLCEASIGHLLAVEAGFQAGNRFASQNRFRQACTQSVGSSGSIDADWDGTVDIDLSTVHRNVGSILKDGVPYCTALLVGDRRLITAKHCVWHTSGDNAMFNYLEACARAPSPTCGISFARLSDALAVPIVGVDVSDGRRAAPILGTDDFVTLHLASPLTGSAQVVARSNDNPPHAVAIVGSGNDGDVLGDDGALTWSDGLRAAAPFMPCAITQRVDTQYLHSCQTWGKFSGAPVIVRAKGDVLEVAAIHLGSDNMFADSVRRVVLDPNRRLNAAVGVESALRLAMEGVP